MAKKTSSTSSNNKTFIVAPVQGDLFTSNNVQIFKPAKKALETYVPKVNVEPDRMTHEQAVKAAQTAQPFNKKFAQVLLKNNKKVYYIARAQNMHIIEVTYDNINTLPEDDMFGFEDVKYITEETFKKYQQDKMHY